MFFPVFGDEKGGFDLVTDEGRGKLFKTIVALSESLEETRKELFKDGGFKDALKNGMKSFPVG